MVEYPDKFFNINCLIFHKNNSVKIHSFYHLTFCLCLVHIFYQQILSFYPFTRDMLVSFKHYLCMLFVWAGLISLCLTFATGFDAYPSGDCKDLSVYPEAVKLLNVSAETPLALCRKGEVAH